MEKIIITIQRLKNYNTEPLNVLSKLKEYIIGENENIPTFQALIYVPGNIIRL